MILDPGETPVEVINPQARALICLVCEHASADIPDRLGDLGLAPSDRYSHAAWDIGALALARYLSQRLDAVLIASRVSRLVYDCNRPPEAPDAIPARAEWIEVPGNRDLSPEQCATRVAEIYVPFRDRLRATLDAFATRPALVTVHSFSQYWFGVPREVEIGILHDDDPALAERMIAQAAPGLRTELNQPYSAEDGVTHTLALHGVPRGLENVMIEVRNDLIADESGVARIGDILTAMLRAALTSQTGHGSAA